MGSPCGVEDLGDEICAIVRDYVSDVERSSERDVGEVAEHVAADLRATSPKRHGGYAGGWAAEPDGESASPSAWRIHNRKKPGLTHLLEKGHGGPHPARAHPHIAPAAERGMAELKRRLDGG